MSSGGGGTSQNTTTQVQEIPAFEQQTSSNNQGLAASLGSQPYPVYNQPLIQGFDPLQTQGQQQAVNAASSFQPYLDASAATVGNAIQAPNIGNYMSPYVQGALQPQVDALQLQQAQQQQGINQQATQANAFGDARQGAAQGVQNFYGNQALTGLEQQGYNTAYQQALQEAQTQQQLQLGGAQQLSALGGQQQNLGLTGAGATYTAGQQQQQLGQQELNTAYQQYLNQVNWPFQMLNVQESALSNSPYNIATATTLPSGNAAAQGFGALTGLAGLLGAAGSNSSSPNVFGHA